MKNLPEIVAITVLSLFQTACDIEPVGSGVWNVIIENPDGTLLSIWSITENGTLNMTDENITVVDGVELEGSRISWSNEIQDSSGAAMTINFSGTVDGDTLQGTIFTTEGNSTVTGERQ
jgi:hypothetical protein